MNPPVVDALLVAGITAAVNAIVTWRVMLAVVNARLDALSQRVGRVEEGADRAHQRIDHIIEERA